ncbi:hypothetical protein ScPMuIL_018102 [Solemya velum]
MDVVQNLPQSDVVILDRGDGTSAAVHLHGATLLSWQCQGKEILFLSQNAVFDHKKAIRGGVPLVFPHFGPWQHGPQHGFARIKRWKLEIPPSKDKHGNVISAFSLEDDEFTRSSWEKRFRLVYTLVLQEKELSFSLVVHSNDQNPFEFTTLLHTYFRTPDVTRTAVIGLQQLKYTDKVNNDQVLEETREAILLSENYDRIYSNCPPEIVVGRIADGNCSAVLRTLNFPDIVLWNPWTEKAKAMSDFGDEEYKNMICVEAGNVSQPIKIDPGQQIEFTQSIQILPAPSL